MRRKKCLVALCICGLALVAALPWLRRERFEARRMVCTSNLTSIASAMLMYCVDHNDALPPDMGAGEVRKVIQVTDDKTW